MRGRLAVSVGLLAWAAVLMKDMSDLKKNPALRGHPKFSEIAEDS